MVSATHPVSLLIAFRVVAANYNKALRRAQDILARSGFKVDSISGEQAGAEYVLAVRLSAEVFAPTPITAELRFREILARSGLRVLEVRA
jgi:hypothetical protein